MRFTAMLFVCVSATASLLRAEDKTINDVDRLSDTDTKLCAFCQSAILRDRGLACTPLAGGSDRWIFEKLVSEECFHAALAKSQAPSWLAASDVNNRLPRFTVDSHRDKVVAAYQAENVHSDKLRSKLTPEQQAKLPGVYLRLEGAMALCRPEFEKLFQNADTQEQIRAFARDAYKQKASPFHRTLFSLQAIDIDEAPIYQAELRRLSAETDWRIVQMLTEAERKRLWDFIAASKDLNAVSYGPPSF